LPALCTPKLSPMTYFPSLFFFCHAKTPVSLGTLPAKLPPLYLSFTPTYLLRKSSVNPYILKLFK
jgi:hypothetical protein